MRARRRALSRLIRLALHRHDPIECWCELNTPGLPVQVGPGPCPECWAHPGLTHELSCPEVTPELFRAYLRGAR